MVETRNSKRVLSLLTACVMSALILCAAPALAATGWQSAYEVLVNSASSGYMTQEYSLYDIDKDGSPELLIMAGQSEADMSLYIYTQRYGTVMLAGVTGASHAKLCGLYGENGVLLVTGHQGYESCILLTLYNGRISRLQQYSDINRYYSNYTAYSSLRMYRVGNLYGLGWNGNPWDNNRTLLNQQITAQNQQNQNPHQNSGSNTYPSNYRGESYADDGTCSFRIGTVTVSNRSKGYIRMTPHPDEDHGLLRHAPNGTYPCVKVVNGYYVIVCMNTMGYVRSDEVVFNRQSNPCYASGVTGLVRIETENMVNVRYGPGADYELAMSVCPGASFLCLGKDAATGWYKLLLPTGEIGYLSNRLGRFYNISNG